MQALYETHYLNDNKVNNMLARITPRSKRQLTKHTWPTRLWNSTYEQNTTVKVINRIKTIPLIILQILVAHGIQWSELSFWFKFYLY